MRRICLIVLLSVFVTSRGEAQETELGRCLECTQQRKFLPAAAELVVVQLIPWSVNRFVRSSEFAKVGPETWWRNIENPWVWDNNSFKTNQFAHPYHGNLYFNTGRTNGYTFWESMLWAGAGSLMWEWFGEAWAPAPNDWFNTTLGGITIGETLYQMSSLTLDNESRGTERAVREIGAAVLNPLRGLNRLIRGHTTGQRPNPDDWRPSKIFTAFDIGYQRTRSLDAGGGSLKQGMLEVVVEYGDRVRDIDHGPFSSIDITMELTTNQPPGVGPLAELQIDGSLGGWILKDTPTSVISLGAHISYEYWNIPAFEFGAQGFHFGPFFRFGHEHGFRVSGNVVGTVLPISAIQSDYFVTLEGRDYDYGPGFGGETDLRLAYRGLFAVTAKGRMVYSPTVSGFNGDHFQVAVELDGRVYVAGRVGVGATYIRYHRNSRYNDFPNVTLNGDQLRLFGSLAVPRWLP